MWERLRHIDKQILINLNNLGGENSDTFWSLVTNPYFWLPLYFIFFYLLSKALMRSQFYKAILFLLFSLVVSVSLNLIVKHWVARTRPNNSEELEGLVRVLHTPQSFSFYSGHAANSFTVTIFLYLVLRRKYPISVVFFVWPFLFAYSRMYLGVHYPSDVLVGALAGIFCGWGFYQLYMKSTSSL